MSWFTKKNRITEAIVRVDGEVDEPLSGYDLNWYNDGTLVVRDGQVGVATFSTWQYIIFSERSEDQDEIE